MHYKFRSLLVIVCSLFLSACASGSKTLVTVTPDTDGKVGTVVVYPTHGSGAPIVLQESNVTTVVDAAGNATWLRMDKEETLRLFGAALVALPPRPSLFILYFNEGSEQLTEESLRVVKTIMDDISGRTAAEVAVIGHTDSLADDAFNDRLALQRADRVKEELVRHGIPAESIAVSGRGKRELLIPTGDNVSEPRNRRVEINVR